MNENSLTELEMERDGLKIRIKKGTSGYTAENIVLQSAPGHHAPAQPQLAVHETAGPPSNVVQIKAPMVGTFYRAPSLETPPYVEVGNTVEVGQVICIIEAMKLMNEIKSEIKGKVVNIFGENGSPVEFGQPLFSIEIS